MAPKYRFFRPKSKIISKKDGLVVPVAGCFGDNKNRFGVGV
jgi:hypothetical protein